MNEMNKMNKIKNFLKEIILKFFSSGLNENERGEIEKSKLERIHLINVYCVFAIVFILFLTIHFLFKNPYLLVLKQYVNGLAYVIMCFLLMIFMRITKNENVGGSTIIVFQYILFFLSLTYVDQAGTLFIFISLFPFIVVYLKGAIKGLMWIMPFVLIYLIIIVLAENKIIDTQYSFSSLSYIFIGLINLSAFAVVSIYKIEKGIETIKSQLHEITEMNRIDFLTNVLNKKTFMELLDMERQRSLRYNWWLKERSIEDPSDGYEISEEDPRQTVNNIKVHFSSFSLLIIDIDHFKMINDTYGHLCGDVILKSIGKELQSKNNVRENDVVGRFGGEEFVVLLPETDYRYAYRVAERLREKIESMIFNYEENKNIKVTISIGIAESQIEDANREDVIKRADEALYLAKGSGRNCSKYYDKSIQ